MKFKGLILVVMLVVLVWVATMPITVPTFAVGATEQTVKQAQETVCMALAESVDSLTADYEYIKQEESSVCSEINILGDINGAVNYKPSVPTVLWDWTDETYIGSSLPIYRGRNVYTNKRFKTTTKKLKVDLDLSADENWTYDRRVNVIVYKKTLTGWTRVATKAFFFSPSSSEHDKTFSFSHTFNGLSDSAQYCIQMVNESTYMGGSVFQYAIDCDIYVSEG